MGFLPSYLLCMPRATMCRDLGFKPLLLIAYYLVVSNLFLLESLAIAPLDGGVTLGLQHRDFSEELSPNSSPEERLVSAVRRSKARKERIEGMLRSVHASTNTRTGEILKASKGGAVPSSATTEGYSLEMEKGDGAFLTSVYVGTPPKKARVIMDTGSDLVWQQCRPCEACFEQLDMPIFDPAQSSTFKRSRCSDKLCQALLPSACVHSNGSCRYTYMYGDTSFTSGELAYDTLTLLDVLGQAHLKVDGFAFGCGYASRGASFVGCDGVLGMGQGPLSLVSQISTPSFSYCLSSLTKNHLSPLLLGDHVATLLHANKSSSMQVTSILTNSFMPTFYYLNLTGISLDGIPLNIPLESFSLKDDGSGGMIIDSGTTITYLEEKSYQIVLNAIQSKIKNPLQVSHPMFGLDLCFPPINEKKLPTLTLHFNGADMILSPSNIFFQVTGIVCFAFGSSADMSILGNMQQQNFQMVYDRKKQQLSFMDTSCDHPST